jgi:hypothetical protein
MKILIAIVLVTLFGCSNGKIEFRRDTEYCDGNGAKFLMNTSSGKKLQFTVKITPHAQANKPTTKLIVLNPGEEKFIGCNTLDDQNEYKIVGVIELK